MASYDFPFVGPAGLDQSKASKAQEFPRLRRVENMRVTKEGLLRKRRGTRRIAAATTDDPAWGPSAPLQGVRLAVHGDQLLVADRKNLWTLSEAADRLENQGDLPTLSLSERLVLGQYGARNVLSCGVARTSLFTCWAWITEHHEPPGSNYDEKFSVHVMTIDNVTGAASPATLVSDEGKIPKWTTIAMAAKTLRVIAINDQKCSVFWGDGPDPNNIEDPTPSTLKYIDITSPTSGPYVSDALPGFANLTINTLLTGSIDNTQPQWFDVVPHGTGYLLAFKNFAASAITVTRYNASHVSQATANISVTGTFSQTVRVQIVGNLTTNANVTCAVVISSNTHLKVALLNNSIAVQGSAYNVAYNDDTSFNDDDDVNGIVACAYPAQVAGHDGIVVGFNCRNTVTGRKFFFAISFANGSQVSNGISEQQTNVFAVAKPWVSDRGTYFPVRYYASINNSYLGILRHETADQQNPGYPMLSPEIRLFDGRATLTEQYDPGSHVAVGTSDVLVPFLNISRKSGSQVLLNQSLRNVVSVVGVDGFRFSLRPRDQFCTAVVGGTTFLSGGTVMGFDGRRPVELNFWSWPDLSDMELTPGADGNMAAGVYLYAFPWEWTDYQGNRHESAYPIDLPEELGGDGMSLVRVTIPEEDDGSGSVSITLPHGIRQSFKMWRTFGSDGRPVSIAIYRSEANGTALFRLEGVIDGGPEANVPMFREVNRNTIVDSSIGTFVDTFHDDDIELKTRQPIYGSGGAGEILNGPPPPSNILCSHDDRLWGIDAADPKSYWYTKAYSNGYALACNPALGGQFPQEAVAMTTQDGNLVAFCADGSVYTIIGRPIDNIGSNSGYEPPQLLSINKICTNRLSLVSAPPGVFYQSDRGIELFVRGGQESPWIGKPIRDTLAQFPVITAAVHASYDSEVLFSCVDNISAPTGGRVLAYNYDVGQWFVRSYQGRAVTSMAIHQGRLVLCLWTANDGLELWREDTGFDDPNGAYVQWVVETTGLTCGSQGIRTNHIGRMHTLQHLQVQGEVFGPEFLQIEESTDDGVTWDSPELFRVNATETAGWHRVYQTQSRKARAHVVRLSGLQSTAADTEGLALYGLVLEGAPLKGQLLLPSSQGG